ncbi:MAG TPA: DUF3617 family protein [Casimicrobiaceae bacterium]|nr:DUF3617 family protein [Casimicrobiaceae bacterium]
MIARSRTACAQTGARRRALASVPLRALWLGFFAAVAADRAAAALNMTEGLWETTLVAEGSTQSAGVKCYTRDDIAEMEKALRGRSSREGPCRYSDFVQSGDSVSYTMTCRLGDDEQTSAVSATYRGDSATGTIRAAGATVTATSRRIGDCVQSSFTR